MKRSACIFGIFLLASCAAEGGDVRPPLADVQPPSVAEPEPVPEPQPEPTPDAGRDVTVEAEAGDPWAPDALMRWDYTGDPWTINIYDARGPDGSCVILPGPWVTQDRTGCFRCMYPDPHPQCECIFERYSEAYPRCPSADANF